MRYGYFVLRYDNQKLLFIAKFLDEAHTSAIYPSLEHHKGIIKSRFNIYGIKNSFPGLIYNSGPVISNKLFK